MMDKKTEVLVRISAATAANCIPCFEHYHGKALAVGLGREEIRQAVDMASQVQKGAHLALSKKVSELLAQPAPITTTEACTCGCGLDA